MPILKQIMVEMKATGARPFSAAAAAATPVNAALPTVPGFTLDANFKPLPIVEGEAPRLGFALSALDEDDDAPTEPRESTYLVRGKVEDDQDPESIAAMLKQDARVVEVYSDVTIQPTLICPGDPALGTHANVEALLDATRLRQRGMDGRGVNVAIVDTGINMAYLNAQGKTPNFNLAKSWAPRPGLTPGSLPVDHGTMCAFDVCIAAPRCTLLDIPVLLSDAPGGTVMEGLLSDAVRAYRHLLTLLQGLRRPGENASLVVSNSWGMFHPTWDYPVGHPGNYSDNPNHPFNRIVTVLERAGADILFAAGNCGADCADGRCQGAVARPIYGANSHPRVLSIGGVDVTKERVGYSSQGPGHLTHRKPDLCGFTHFQGSGVYAADGGTSAATPVVAGLVAAIRTRLPMRPGNTRTSPAHIRNLLRKTAEDKGTPGYDFSYGYGIVNGPAIAALFPTTDIVAPALAAEIAAPAPREEIPCPTCGAQVALPPRAPTPLARYPLLEVEAHPHPKAGPKVAPEQNGHARVKSPPLPVA